MRREPARTSLRDQAGFALIEVMVSALIAVMMTGAVVGLLNASGRSGGEQRHRSQAFSVAQEDQARMRSMQISSLNGYNKTEPVTLNGIEYTVHSTASFVNDTTQVLSCRAGSSSADYVKLASEVSWKGTNSQRRPVVLESIMAPSNGSLDPTHGTLTFQYLNSEEVPISGVTLSGTGPANVNGTTDTSGCVVFPDRPEGTYTIAQTLAAGFVDPNGSPPSSFTTDVLGNGTDMIQKHFDKEGAIKPKFTVRNYAGVVVSSTSDSAILFQNQWTGAQEKLYGTPGGTQQAEFSMKPLYPFASSAYTVYPGACEKNKPSSPTSITLARNTTVTPELQLPALYLTVKRENTSGTMEAAPSAKVIVRDDECQYSGSKVKRVYSTNPSGQLENPGLPWSKYDICASVMVKSTISGRTVERIRIIERPEVVVHETSGTILTLELRGSTVEGECT